MAAFYSGDYVGAVVADVGHYSTKIGWAGDDYPRSYFRSTVAVLREQGRISQAKYDYYTHYIESNQSDGDWTAVNPINRTTGLYDEDWHDLVPEFLRHGYQSALSSASIQDHPLLLVERAYNPPPMRQQTIECLFEECQVPAAFLGRDAALAAFGCGRVTSTVIDIGSSGTTVTPVYEGYVEAKGIRRSPIGTTAMDEMILEHLDQLYSAKQRPVRPFYQVKNKTGATRHPSIHTAARLHLALDCREVGAGAAINTASSAPGFQAPNKTYELPDGTALEIPSRHRFAVADLLFGSSDSSVQRREEITERTREDWNAQIAAAAVENKEEEDEDEEEFSEAAAVGISKRRTKRDKPLQPKLFNPRVLNKACASYLQTSVETLTSSPLASMVCDAAYRCDRDQQVALLGNVVVGGGGACLGPSEQAVPDVIKEQVEAVIHTHTPGWRVKVLSPGLAERSVLSWMGGSILGSMGTFHDMWITKAEYEEWGSAIVNRKCP